MIDDQKIIRVKFGQGAPGTLEAETFGFKGAACEEVMAKVMQNVGEQVSAKHTDDYYEDPDPQKEVQVE